MQAEAEWLVICESCQGHGRVQGMIQTPMGQAPGILPCPTCGSRGLVIGWKSEVTVEDIP